jgi:hypothetical protein
MRLACYTQEEIAERESLTHPAIGMILKETADLPKLTESQQAAANHAVDFELPLYNVWKRGCALRDASRRSCVC